MNPSGGGPHRIGKERLRIELHRANGSWSRRKVVVRMSFSQESPISAVDMMRFGRPSWLPPFGYGNGLDALFWACIAELPHSAIDGILEALREKDIPGWAAPVKTTRRLRHENVDAAPYRLWVSTLRFDSAENVLIDVLNSISKPVLRQKP